MEPLQKSGLKSVGFSTTHNPIHGSWGLDLASLGLRKASSSGSSSTSRSPSVLPTTPLLDVTALAEATARRPITSHHRVVFALVVALVKLAAKLKVI